MFVIVVFFFCVLRRMCLCFCGHFDVICFMCFAMIVVYDFSFVRAFVDVGVNVASMCAVMCVLRTSANAAVSIGVVMFVCQFCICICLLLDVYAKL